MRKGFYFLASYFEALKSLDDDKLRLKCYDAIIEYGLSGVYIEPDDPIVKTILLLVKPVIDKNYQRYLNGLKGGRPRKNPPEPSPDKKKVKKDPVEHPEEPMAKEEPPAHEEPEIQGKGRFKNVILSSEQYEELVEEKGEAAVLDAIDYLDSYIEEKSPEEKADLLKRNHQATILRWVFDAVDKKKQTKAGKIGNNIVKMPQNPFNEGMKGPAINIAELEEKLLDN